MKLTIEISEMETGDVALHVKREAGMATMREAAYAEAITQSILAHIQEALPAIAKKMGAYKTTTLNNPRNS